MCLCNWKNIVKWFQTKKTDSENLWFNQNPGCHEPLATWRHENLQKYSRSTWHILRTWTANYMLVWQQNNEEMMTELQIPLLTDFIQHCTQHNKAMWTNKHAENPNTNRLPRPLCINSRGWCLERLPLLENLQSLHCLMCKFGNSSPQLPQNNVTYRGEKQKVLSIKSDFSSQFLFEIIFLQQTDCKVWLKQCQRWYSPSSHTFGK
jgi:hypothetical protein